MHSRPDPATVSYQTAPAAGAGGAGGAGGAAGTTADRGGPPERHGGGHLAHGPFVRAVIFLTLLLVLVMLSLIYYRWLTVREPTTAIVLQGDSSLDGAQIDVSALVPGERPHLRAQARLDKANQFTTPVLLEPGTYHLLVKLGDRVIREQDVTVDRINALMIDLPTLLRVVGDPYFDGAHVVLTPYAGEPLRQEIKAANDFTASWWVPPGPYHVTVMRGGQTLLEKDIVIRPHVPEQVELSPQRGERAAH